MSGWRSHIAIAILSLLLGVVACVYVLNLSTPTVRTASGLARIGFGWPFPWLFQDLTSRGYADLPVVVGYSSYRGAPDIPTSVDGLALLTDVVVIGAAVFALLSLSIAGLRRRRSVTGGTAARPQGENDAIA